MKEQEISQQTSLCHTSNWLMPMARTRKSKLVFKTKAGKEKFVIKMFQHLDKSYKLMTKDDCWKKLCKGAGVLAS
jgi:hypothetical protein